MDERNLSPRIEMINQSEGIRDFRRRVAPYQHVDLLEFDDQIQGHSEAELGRGDERQQRCAADRHGRVERQSRWVFGPDGGQR